MASSPTTVLEAAHKVHGVGVLQRSEQGAQVGRERLADARECRSGSLEPWAALAASEEGGYVRARRVGQPRRRTAARMEGVVVGAEEGARLVEHLASEVRHHEG